MTKAIGENKKINGTIDIAKFLMAVLVVGIHTEPLGFNIWLDRGFGIITRLCVPFFFVASSYFFFRKNNSPLKYVKRLFILYLIWSIIYLPFDITKLKLLSVQQILIKYLWSGVDDQALWYLCGSIIGFLIVFALSKFLDYKKILLLGIVFLIIGCFKSTWAPMVENVFNIPVYDLLGSRNGLFYGFPYYAVGMYIAKTEGKKSDNWKPYLIGSVISFMMLVAESLVFILVFKTTKTVLWISVLPLTYFVFSFLKNINISIPLNISLVLRKLSTIIYVSHGLFLIVFINMQYMMYFLCVTIASIIFGLLMLVLNEKIKILKWLKYLY